MIKNGAQFTCERREDALVVHVRGEIDHHSAVWVRSEIDARILKDKPKKTVIDLSGISFMDSSGIGLVMGRYRTLQKKGAKLNLTNLPPNIYKVMKLAGIERLANIEKENSYETT